MTMIEKIRSIACMEEFNGFSDQLKRDGGVLSNEEREALYRRQIELMKAK